MVTSSYRHMPITLVLSRDIFLILKRPGCYKIPDSVDLITELPNDDSDIDVVLREPIPIRLSFDGVETWMASFEEANIAMPGGTRREAKELLSYDIIATFEYFHAEEEKLIPDLKQALMVLRQYIAISE